jgi:hypothetical protein
LRACFGLNSLAYNAPENRSRPERTTVLQASPTSLKTTQELWYPAQWRGALALGDVKVLKVTAIDDGKRIKIPNVVGPAIVEAVGLEKTGKGPRLFCSNGFPACVSSELQHFFRPVKNQSDVSEFLWPALQGRKARFDRNMNDFWDMWLPAVNLWKSKQRPHIAFEHYDEFLRLLIRSAVCAARLKKAEPQAREYLRNRIRLDLSEALIDEYLEA